MEGTAERDRSPGPQGSNPRWMGAAVEVPWRQPSQRQPSTQALYSRYEAANEPRPEEGLLGGRGYNRHFIEHPGGVHGILLWRERACARARHVAVSVVGDVAGRTDDDAVTGDVPAKLLITFIGGTMGLAGLLQRDDEGELQRGADEWLIIMENGCRRLQELVGELSVRSNEEPGIDGGAISLADWLNDTTEDILDVMWELEEGPDPRLEAYIDWWWADGIMATRRVLFAKGRDLRFLLEDRLASEAITIPTIISTTPLSTSEAATTVISTATTITTTTTMMMHAVTMVKSPPMKTQKSPPMRTKTSTTTAGTRTTGALLLMVVRPFTQAWAVGSALRSFPPFDRGPLMLLWSFAIWRTGVG
ncbi:hypothetical protein CBR_g45474 [Chara braunii]|uniref:Uncharacterized protein n=1 Tax=Chara braunii TaxID=69332 RepID=A0A388LYM5_CHABU|nr:hypothetical protein CBR_g45474 [Chara braunii]|eukprot:GBG87417.1 hypothetical protein CBR_g45474 [Chara braunii]